MEYTKKQKASFEINNYISSKFLILVLVSSFTFIFLKSLFVFVAFILLEYIAGELKVWFHFDIPFDFAAMAIIFFSYTDFSLLINILLILNLIITRLLYSGLNERHVIKIIVLFFIGLLVPILSNSSFISAMIIAYLIRYVLEHFFLTIFNGRFMVEYIPIQFSQLVFSYFFFIIFF